MVKGVAYEDGELPFWLPAQKRGPMKPKKTRLYP